MKFADEMSDDFDVLDVDLFGKYVNQGYHVDMGTMATALWTMWWSTTGWVTGYIIAGNDLIFKYCYTEVNDGEGTIGGFP